MKCLEYKSSTYSMKIKRILDLNRVKNHVVKNQNRDGCSYCIVIHEGDFERVENLLISMNFSLGVVKNYE